ncbi:two-component sensor histidine kinase [Sphingobium sp. SCG-1]|uniref:ATP-binding protein n=1 Tax=Sphingobium sp. SCG-1 TaxID=2072936 RepID=UPI000CD6BA7F|nr:ATP-binding protein [Sphingobium sp. SCG-1]AUW57940.1 two-component sensor histidine kinase [Sphingobium sp. SCG-1]
MTGIWQRLLPKSLVGQIILIVALALFVAQAINFTLLLRERNRMLLTTATAPAVARIVDGLDRSESDRPRGAPNRVGFSNSRPFLGGVRRADAEKRALDMLQDVGIRPINIMAFEDVDEPRFSRRSKVRDRFDPLGARKVHRLTLTIEYRPGLWVTAQSRMGKGLLRLNGWLVGQTLILYVIVLLPLLWVGRRLARPLKELTEAARQFATTGAADPVQERGPGDVRDMTMAFNAMRARLLSMLDEKDRMLGAIGHDLRTPLASLRVRTESVEDEAERARMSDTIEEMSRMLDDILSLARAGRSMEPSVKVDLSALADAVVEDFIELGSLVEMADSDRAVAPVRPQLIRRALRNLIENAVVYGDRARVSVVGEEAVIRISVSDEGPGIAEDRMDEMMEPFTRLEGSRNRETGGAGLGLALVRAIVAEHGGSLRLVNRPEGGLEASLILPVH